MFIVAGETSRKKTDESKPVAVPIDYKTTLVERTGEPLPAALRGLLPEGSVIVVEGKQNNRRVIRATRVVTAT